MRYRRSIFPVLAMLGGTVLAGCASNYVRPSEAKVVAPDRIYIPARERSPFAGCSQIVVTRDNGTFVGSAGSVKVDINHKKAFSLWPSEKAVAYVKPGAYTVNVNVALQNPAPVFIQPKSGEKYILRVQNGMTTFDVGVQSVSKSARCSQAVNSAR